MRKNVIALRETTAAALGTFNGEEFNHGSIMSLETGLHELSLRRTLNVLESNKCIQKVGDVVEHLDAQMYKVVGDLNFETPEGWKTTTVDKRKLTKANSVSSRITEIFKKIPLKFYTKSEIWEVLDDSSVVRVTFNTAFPSLINAGVLKRSGDNKHNMKFALNSDEIETPVVRPKKKLISKFILENMADEKSFKTKDVFDYYKDGELKIQTVNSMLSKMCLDGKLVRLKKGLYRVKNSVKTKKGFVKSPIQSNDATYNKSFDPNKCPNKYAIADQMYEKVAEHIEGECLILSGPNVARHIQSTKQITKGNHMTHLVDFDPFVFSSMLNLVDISTVQRNMVNLMCCNVMDVNINTPFQDLDFMGTPIGSDNQGYESGEILSMRLLKQMECNYDKAAMSFTFCMRRQAKNEVFRFVNNILHMVGGHIKSFDGVFHEWGGGEKMSVEKQIHRGYGYKHKPDWLMKGRIIDFEFYTYRDSGNSMFSCLLIYK